MIRTCPAAPTVRDSSCTSTARVVAVCRGSAWQGKQLASNLGRASQQSTRHHDWTSMAPSRGDPATQHMQPHAHNKQACSVAGPAGPAAELKMPPPKRSAHRPAVELAQQAVELLALLWLHGKRLRQAGKVGAGGHVGGMRKSGVSKVRGMAACVEANH
jgi:hypothetical protein